MQIYGGDVLVSYSVESLFKKLVILETVDTVMECLDSNIAETVTRPTLGCRVNYFSTVCTMNTWAMGSPLPPVTTNLHMEMFKKDTKPRRA